MSLIRRELKKLADGVKVDIEEVEQIVKAEVLKREIVEGEQAEVARVRVSKFYRKGASSRRTKKNSAQEPPVTASTAKESVTEKLLRESQESESAQDSGSSCG